MTIANATNKSGPYFYNGAATAFAYGFKIFDAAHIRVVEAVIATGVETDLVLNTDYTVTGVGADTGTVVISPARAAGKTVTLVRNVPFTQELDLQNQGAYFAESVEAALDAGVARDQQLAEAVSRAVVVPISTDPTDLATLIVGIIQLLGIVNDVTAVAAISAQVVAVAGNASNINTVAGINPAITTVAGIAADVTAVAAIQANVTAVVAISADVQTVAAIAGAVVTVAGIAGAVTAVAGNSANINAVNANKANIDTVAGINAAVSTVAGIAANVTTVAGMSANIATVVANMPAIVDAPNQASAAANSALEAAGYAAMVNFWKGTQAAYDAIAVKDPDRLYFITA